MYSLTTLSAPLWTTTATGYEFFNATDYDYSASVQTLTIYGVQAPVTTAVTVSFTLDT